MIKSLLIAGFVALATASPAYYGYSSRNSQPSYAAPKETYQEVPKASYSSYKPSYGAASYEKPHPYNFGYQIDDGYGTNTHQEEEGDDYGNKRGSYGYTDANGIYRKVDYVADGYGFRAKVSTNEPGTADQDPADVKMYVQEPPANAYQSAPKYQPAAAYSRPSSGGYRPAPAPAPAPASYEPEPAGYGGQPQGYKVSIGHDSGYQSGGYGGSYKPAGYSRQHFKMLQPKYESRY